MTPSPYSDLNQVLAVLVSRVQDILGDSFIGAYLQGSFAVGDFDRHSDVDFIIAVDDEPAAKEMDALQAMHGHIFELPSRWAQHLEGSYFPRAILRRATARPEPLWYLDNGSRSLIQSTHCNTVLVRWVVREKGVTLSGPDPRTLVDPISSETLRADIFDTMMTWGREILEDPEPYNNRFYQGFLVLNYCRMLHDLFNGTNGSKREGAEWAKRTLDPDWADLIDGAWDGRPNPAQKVRTPADPVAIARTLNFIRTVMDEAEKIAGR